MLRMVIKTTYKTLLQLYPGLIQAGFGANFSGTSLKIRFQTLITQLDFINQSNNVLYVVVLLPF